MSDDFRWYVPRPQLIPEALQIYNVTREFYWEVQQRDEFECYCEWYRSTAVKHQQELQKMQRDINVLGWFYRKSNVN